MLYNDPGLSDRDVTQLAFGVSTGDIHYLIQRYWTRVLNPNCLSPAELAMHIGDNIPAEERDRLAHIAEEAYANGLDEATVVLSALRGYMTEQHVFGSRRMTRLMAEDRRFPKLAAAANIDVGNHQHH